jgi:hypothetical protein
MAQTYPLDFPNDYISSISIRMNSAVAETSSPFTYSSDTQVFAGQMWMADITLAPMSRPDAAAWTGFFAALNGKEGRFLLGDPAATAPLGTATSLTVSGVAGDGTVSAIVPSGKTLLSGDYFQLGTGIDSTLHMVTKNYTGTGSEADLEIYPALRKTRTSVVANLDAPKGVFKLSTNERGFNITAALQYSFTFGATELVSTS